MSSRTPLATLVALLLAGPALADAPVASYLFPAGARRGTTATVHVGGLNLHHRCSFELLGAGVHAEPVLLPAKTTTWFEGPVIPQPDSQQAEDYPRDFDATIRVDPDAAPGPRFARVWTSQGATPALSFVVGELPEVVEQEIDGDPVPVPVALPVTVNGRIFPREDVDLWSFEAKRGRAVTCEVNAARLGSPLDARIAILDPSGRTIAEGDDGLGADPLLHLTAPEDGTYRVKIHDINVRGGQSYVYRLTVTTGPYVDTTYPLGGRRGSTTQFELLGAGVPAGPVAIALPETGPDDVTRQIQHDGRTSNPFLVALSDLPEVLESEPNDDPARATPVHPPLVANGRIGRAGDVDGWAVPLAKGETVLLDVDARTLGSPLDAVLTIVDAGGKELAHTEGTSKDAPDPSLRFSAPADGTYVVRVADRFRSRGGPRLAYRLRIDRGGTSDFRLRFASDALTLARKGQGKLKVDVERLGGFAGPIALAVEGLPAGVSAASTTIGANQGAAEIAFKAEPDAPIRSSRVTIVGTAKDGDRTITRTAGRLVARGEPALDSVRVAVALATPFQVTADTEFRWAARGTVHHRRYRIERGGFDGPIEVRLADRQARHLQGVTGPTLTIPPGVSAFDYPVRLPPWMETGRTSRSVVLATATVKDADGTEHEVSYSSPKAEVQVIAVVEPGRLGIEAGRSSVPASPGGRVAVPVRIVRSKDLQGAATLELVVPPHLQGISAEPVAIPGDQSEASLAIAFGALPDAINAPVVIRATIMDRGDPVIAEAKIEIEPRAIH